VGAFKPLPPQPSAADDLNVWTIRRSTDRRYVYERFARLAQRHPLRFSAGGLVRVQRGMEGAFASLESPHIA
jgi:hypothetical protein